MSCCLMLLDVFYRAISYIMSSLFYPVFTFFLLAVCLSYWAVTAVYPPHQAMETLHTVALELEFCLLSVDTCNTTSLLGRTCLPFSMFFCLLKILHTQSDLMSMPMVYNIKP